MMHSIRHNWPEKAGFLISRPQGREEYTFLHFMTPITFRIDGQTICARPGACIFFAPGQLQWFHSDQEVIHNWAHFYPAFAQKLQQYDIPENTILYPKDASFISELFQKLEVEYFSDHPHKETLTAALIDEFLIRLSRALYSEQSLPLTNRKERRQLQKVRQSILSQPERHWTVTEMAALMNLSPSRFHAVYKSEFATSPMQDVIEARVSYAQTLLLSFPHLSIPEIAEKLGYSDQYHFIRQFKSLTRESPAAFRKKRR